MAGEWSTSTIAECAANEPYSTQIGPFGEKIRAKMYTPAGAPILRGTNVNTEERFHDDDFVFIDSELAEREFSKFVCEADDVILCHKGTLGKIGIVPKHSHFKRYIMGNSMMKVRCDRRKLAPSFLYYWLTSQEGQDYLFSRVSQVGVPQIQRPLTTLREATIPLPPLPEQRAIAHILGTLDDKIELNRRMSETLEAMARALFKSWFVDFDPVRAKMEGRDPGLPKHIADLFPDRLVDSELGEIPEGWKVKPLDEVAHFQNGLALQKYRPKPGEERLPVIKIAQLRSGKASSDEWATADLKPECIIDDGDVVFSWSGSLLVRVWCGGRAALNQHLFKVTSEEYPRWFFLDALLSHLPEFRRIAAGKATTMGHIQRHHLTDARCVVPTANLLAAAGPLFSGLVERGIANDIQVRHLTNLRDTLLPKLVSGQLRVKDADKCMENAL